MPTKLELRKIARTRLLEVKALNNAGFYDAARYMAGYVIETALKARICKILNSDYPDTGAVSKSFLTHNFDILVQLAGLSVSLDDELNANVNFKTNWSLVTSWKETIRYNPIGSASAVDVNDIISALEDQADGVFTWIKKRW